MVNVDLLIKDKHGKYLLSWRNDDHGNGWHVPGGIVRVKETLIERVERTSLKEIGCLVNYNPKPVNFAELVYLQTEIRPHFYSFLFDCMIPENFDIGKQPYKPGEMGHLAWHTKFPHDMIPVHKMYKKFFTETENGKFQI
jgi:colanic acid biosynthesis protein WcaH